MPEPASRFGIILKRDVAWGVGSARSPRYRRLLEQLKAARKAAGLTQVQVATALGEPQSFVSKCESGERRIDAVELERFAKLYRKQLAFFLPDSPAS